MLYLASAQPPTAQLGAIKCDFYEAGTSVVVINKLNRLEINAIQEDGRLELIEEVPVWSGIAAIESVKLPSEERSCIVVLTTCLKLFLLSFQPHLSPKLQTIAQTSVSEPFGRISEYQTIQVDPHNRCLVVHAYDGLLRIVPLLTNSSSPSKASRRGSTSTSKKNDKSTAFTLDSSYNVRVSNLNVTSLALLSTPLDSAPAFALVNTDHHGNKVLTTYNIDLDEKDVEEGPVPTETLQDLGSELCLGIPEQAGVIVIGEESISFFDSENVAEDSKGKRKATPGRKIVKCRLPLARITSFAYLSRERLLLGDIFGKLFLVDIEFGAAGVARMKATDLGDTTSPTAIVPISSSLVYLASRFGDAQLVNVSSLPNTAGASDRMEQDSIGEPELELLASYPNLAPIVDSCIVGGDGGSAGFVVTCSGAYKSGSLRIVRRGVGLTELASLELEGVQRMWSVTDQQSSQYLVLGYFDETRILQVSSAEEEGEMEYDVEETELSPFKTDIATLFATHLGDLLVQVTQDTVNYSSHGDSGSAQWSPDGKQKITAAAAAGEGLLVAVQGGTLVLLSVVNGSLTQQSVTSFETEIASLAINCSSRGAFAVVGLWTSQNIHLLSLPDLSICATQTLSTTYLIRSVLLTTFSDGATVLFAGLGDGSLVTTTVSLEKKEMAGNTLKTVVLGNRPFLLSEFSQNGKGANVFACSDRPTIISRAKDRLVYSSVNVEDVSAVAPLSSSTGSSLAVTSPSLLRIGRIDAIQQIDIRTVPLDEDEPRRIAHDPKNRTFGVLCSRRDVDRSSGYRSTIASVRFLAEETFTTRAITTLGSNEEGQAITRLVVGESSYFAIGTAIVEEGVAEPEKGRLLVYQQVDTEKFEQVAAIEINGCPFAAVDAGDGAIAVAVNSQVLVYSLDSSTSTLSLSATWSGAFIALTLATGPDSTIVVGDALRSITVLKYTSGARPKLEEVAKDYRSRYMVGVESISPSTKETVEGPREFIGAETDLNLFTVQHDPSTAVGRLEDAGNLTPRGSFHLGEMVSRFRHGVFGQQYGDSSGVAQPKLVFTTSAGSIGVIAELDEGSSTLLSSLERNMRCFVEGTGGLSQEEFRSFKADKRSITSSGFVDGTFVQQFLDLPLSEQDRIMGGRNEYEKLTMEKEEVVRVLEEVGRLH